MYDAIHAYVVNGTLPLKFPSNKSNFVIACSHYTVNSKGCLCREGKVVVQKKDLGKLWEQYHDHTGMNTCWNRIKKK